MRIETFYTCETCGSRYASRRIAEACEATVLPPCPVEPGTAVRVRERYDAPQTDTVAEVAVGATQLAWMLADLPEDHPTVVRTLAGRSALHRWVIRLGERHQMGKDPDTFTDEVQLSDLEIDGQPLERVA